MTLKFHPKWTIDFKLLPAKTKAVSLALDWKKSDITDFRTSAHNKEVNDKPPNGKDINQLDSHAKHENDVNPSLAPTSSDVLRLDGEKGPGLVLSIELIAIIVVGCVVFLLILVGIVDKLTCPQKSGDDIEDGDEDDSKA